MPVATIEKTLTDAPQMYALHTDHLRSTRLVTSEATAQGIVSVVESTDYDAFGKITNHTQSTDFAERKKFTSHEFDSSTGYTYAKARYLNTDIGRFIAQDRAFIYAGDAERFESIAGVPLVAYLLDPQLQNSYSYARNNPMKYNDPTGNLPALALPLAVVAPEAALVVGAAAIVGVLAYSYNAGQMPTPNIFNNTPPDDTNWFPNGQPPKWSILAKTVMKIGGTAVAIRSFLEPLEGVINDLKNAAVSSEKNQTNYCPAFPTLAAPPPKEQVKADKSR